MNIKFKIEKGIIPPRRSRGPLSEYPLDEMEVNDSFKVNVEKEETSKAVVGRIGAAISYYRRKINPNKKFTCRTIDNYVRCWRIL